MEDFNNDWWKQFRTREEAYTEDHCRNCGVLLFDDDDPEPYEKGYCRGCQIQDIGARTSRALGHCVDTMNKIERIMGQIAKSR